VSRRAVSAAVVAVLAAGGLAGAVLAGGGDDGSGGAIAWAGEPLTVHQPELPDDTGVAGFVRNGSLRAVTLVADEVRVVDPSGRAVRSTARYAQGYTHALYPPRDRPRGSAAVLEERLGERVTVKPGARVPLTLSWRVRRGDPAPVRAELGGGLSLSLR
jgi:hypothetical protein